MLFITLVNTTAMSFLIKKTLSLHCINTLLRINTTVKKFYVRHIYKNLQLNNS
jgi:hypothetical protein